MQSVCLCFSCYEQLMRDFNAIVEEEVLLNTQPHQQQHAWNFWNNNNNELRNTHEQNWTFVFILILLKFIVVIILYGYVRNIIYETRNNFDNISYDAILNIGQDRIF